MYTSNGSWTYKFCESCLKNSHEKNEMIREKVGFSSLEEMWVCPVCGATKRL